MGEEGVAFCAQLYTCTRAPKERNLRTGQFMANLFCFFLAYETFVGKLTQESYSEGRKEPFCFRRCCT